MSESKLVSIRNTPDGWELKGTMYPYDKWFALPFSNSTELCQVAIHLQVAFRISIFKIECYS